MRELVRHPWVAVAMRIAVGQRFVAKGSLKVADPPSWPGSGWCRGRCQFLLDANNG